MGTMTLAHMFDMYTLCTEGEFQLLVYTPHSTTCLIPLKKPEGDVFLFRTPSVTTLLWDCLDSSSTHQSGWKSDPSQFNENCRLAAVSCAL